MKNKEKKEKDIENNSDKYYSLDGESDKNECKECVCTFVKDTALIVLPFVCVIGPVLLIIFNLK